MQTRGFCKPTYYTIKDVADRAIVLKQFLHNGNITPEDALLAHEKSLQYIINKHGRVVSPQQSIKYYPFGDAFDKNICSTRTSKIFYSKVNQAVSDLAREEQIRANKEASTLATSFSWSGLWTNFSKK